MNRPSIRKRLENHILVLDGATGTRLGLESLSAQDFGGEKHEGCFEALLLTRPALIAQVHREYLAAGADIIETNTFSGTPLVLAEFGLEARSREINRLAAQIARKAADEASSSDRPRFVAGSIGPTTKTLLLGKGVLYETLADSFRVQALGLVEGGADYLLIETASDPLNIKAAFDGLDAAFEELGTVLPVALSVTIEQSGMTLCGQPIEAAYVSSEHRDLLYFGLNCATGPELMGDPLRTLSAISQVPIACVPNAGLPNEDGEYLETPEILGATVQRFVNEGWINLLGGCCGTTAAHIATLAGIASKASPRSFVPERWSRVSGIDYLSLEEERRPLIVGERTNVIGSRRFRKMIAAEDFERAAELGKAQVAGGAHVLDVCLANPDRDEGDDMLRLISSLSRKVRVPLMIDSTDVAVIGPALQITPGKAIINSVNLEDGGERLARVTSLARRYGAALVVGCIDEDPEQGMALTAERKVSVARRSVELLSGSHGIDPADLIIDPLVFPCGSGDNTYRGSAWQTIEGLRAIKRELPACKTVLGISNVSFGLPPAGREVLNSVFLHECTEAGLDLAIVNSEKLVRYAMIPQNEREASLDLLRRGSDEDIAAFAALFRDRPRERDTSETEKLPVETRLARRIVEASREGLDSDLEEALTRYAPLEIINGPLLDGMDEVGRLFGKNEMIVAEVLQSAEVMKAAVSYLELTMGESVGPGKGRVLLATVKGDVHDIGKNLVSILIANNGYEVIDLGIKVDPGTLSEAIREKKPDFVGLSGLLVKSAHQMVATAAELRALGHSIPILVGGAALSRRFTESRILPEYEGLVLYARDAMDGLALVNLLVDEEGRRKLEREVEALRSRVPAPNLPEEPPERNVEGDWGLAPFSPAPTVPSPPHFERTVFGLRSREALSWINEQMLYGRHLGLRGSIKKLTQAGHPKLAELRQLVEKLTDEAAANGWFNPRGIFRFFAADAEGETLVLRDEAAGRELARMRFPRQQKRDGLCISDWIERPGGRPDSLAMFVVTTGSGVRAQAARLKESGEFLASHVLQALALEMAEATAEVLHREIRRLWGIPDSPDLTREEVFRTRYRGLRVSFGYPACPDLEQQQMLFDLLEPDEIGVELTDGFMMDPEASVSALVFHHPEAKYFAAR